MIKCSSCGSEINDRLFISSIQKAFVNQQWVIFACKACKSLEVLHIINETVSRGIIDGAPGPCFITSETFRVPGLIATWERPTSVFKFGDLVVKVKAV